LGNGSVRMEVLRRDNKRCQICGTGGSKKNKLTMHHKIYRKNRGKYSDENLITYCRKCHDTFHEDNG